MWHGCAGRLQGAANVTTTRLCASRHAILRGSLCRGPCSSRAPLQLTTLHCTNNKTKWIPVRHVRQGQLMSQGKSKTAHWFWKFTRNLQFKCSGKLGSHASQFVECVCPDAFATTPIAEKKCTKDFSKAPCQSVVGGSQGSILCIHNSDEGRRLLTHDSVICDPVFLAGKRKEQTVRGSTAELSKKRARARLSSYKETDASDLLMRFSFNIQCQLRVRKLRLGSQRKAKHLHRISTLRGKRLKTEVRFFLSRPSAESENLTKQVNGEELLKLRSRSQVPAPRDGVESVTVETMVQERAGSEEPSPAHGRTSARKRTPKSCDCCGTNCKLPAAKAHRAKKAEHQGHTPRKRGRKRKVPEAELELEAELEPEAELDCEAQAPGDAPASDDEPAPVNGTASPSSEPGVDVEVEPPVSHLEPCTNPLRDHHYCKTEGVRDDCTAGLQAEQRLPRDQLTAADVHEEMTELIHEFLENFYGKYGSFIPLSETDVLEHLNGKFGTDLTDRKTSICTEVTKYQAGLASAPMHCFKVAYNKHTLTLDDLSTLDEQNWLNDQVINMYGELIMDAVNHKVHFFNSFFHRQLVAKGYEGVKRWTKKVDLFTKNLLLIPIHLEIHWSLITVDICNQQVNFYDSQGITFKHAVDNILRYILAEAKEKQQAVYQKGWKVIVNKSIPQQKNDSDCGVFVLEYCKCLALKEPLQFTQEDMPKVRKRIYKELCERKLKTEVVSV